MRLDRLPAEELFELAREVTGRGGRLRLRVSGHSMTPAIFPGERVVLAPLADAGPRVGDIVLARTPQGVMLHRVWQRVPQLVLRGDNPSSGSCSVALEQVACRVESVVPGPWGRLRRLFSRWLAGTR